MSDEPQVDTGNGQEPGQEPAQEPSAEPKFVTQAELDSIVDAKVKELASQFPTGTEEERVRRIAQSQVATDTRGVRERLKEVEDYLGLQRRLGHEVSPELEREMRTQAVIEHLAGPETPPEPQPQSPGQGQAVAGEISAEDQAYQKQVVDEALEIIADMGTEFDENDPEAAYFQTQEAQANEFAFRKAARKYAKDKLKRLAENPPDPDGGNPEGDPLQAAARSGGSLSQGTPSANPLEGIMDSGELFKRTGL